MGCIGAMGPAQGEGKGEGQEGHSRKCNTWWMVLSPR